MLNRRDLLKQSAFAALALRVGPEKSSPVAMSQARTSDARSKSANPQAINALALAPFVDPLVLPARARGSQPLRVDMREVHVKMHRDLAPTRLWSYGDDAIGPLIEARAGVPLSIEWRNRLPQRHFLTIDYTLHGSGRELPESRTVVHVHGGRSPAASDGYPESWYAPGKSRVCHYPNRQDAAMLWYHDHAMGTNRLNLYAGLMGVYLLRDDDEDALGLPAGRYELPLMIYDRIFDSDGQLLYPVSPDPAHPWVEEVFGEAMVVNGRVQPFHQVEPRRYRLRIVNAANGRFFRLGFTGDASFQQIGADQGLLPAPVTLTSLVLAPGERADLVVDFAAMRGKSVVMTNGAFEMMQFRVSATPAAHTSRVPEVLRPRTALDQARAARHRELTLNEFDDPQGKAMVMLLNRTPWHMPVTEVAKLGSTEVWSLVNLTDDTHPIHIHHVRFQVLDRTPFDRDRYLLSDPARKPDLRYTGAALAPHANEAGWKDVVQCPPNIVTRIHVSFAGYAGRYLWHCHLQEHEANDMMRPYDIVA